MMVKKHPCILIIPGGGYDHLSDHEGENVAIELNKLGISAFVLYYRIAPYRHPIYLYDIKRTMRYIRYNAEKYGIYEDKIGIMGFQLADIWLVFVLKMLINSNMNLLMI